MRNETNLEFCLKSHQVVLETIVLLEQRLDGVQVPANVVRNARLLLLDPFQRLSYVLVEPVDVSSNDELLISYLDVFVQLLPYSADNGSKDMFNFFFSLFQLGTKTATISSQATKYSLQLLLALLDVVTVRTFAANKFVGQFSACSDPFGPCVDPVLEVCELVHQSLPKQNKNVTINPQATDVNLGQDHCLTL